MATCQHWAPADASWPLDKQQNKSARPLKAQHVVHLSAPPPPEEERNHQQRRSAGREAKCCSDLHQSNSQGRWEIVAQQWRVCLGEQPLSGVFHMEYGVYLK